MEKTAKLSPVLRFGIFEVDQRLSELRRNGVLVHLQKQPFQILLILLDHANEVVDRDFLRRELWPAETVVDFDRNLNKAMNKLRHALGDNAENPRFIVTLHRKGYRFIAPVTYVAPEPAESTLPESVVPSAATSADSDQPLPSSSGEHTEPALPQEEPAFQSATTISRWKQLPLAVWGALIVTATLLLVLMGSALWHLRTSRETPRTALPRRSIAVLEFRNLSGREDEAWLATAIADWLATDLSSGDQLRTISLENVARAEKELSLSSTDSLNRDSLGKIGRRLSTDYVVVGAYGLVGSDAGRRIRLDLRLQDTRSGETLASLSDTGTESDLFSLVARVGGQLRSQLGIDGLTREQTSQVATALPSNHDAARFYSQALDALHVFDAITASELLQKSIALEPNYSLSHAALATVWEELGYDGRAQAEAKIAFDLSSKLPRPEHLLVEGRYDELSKKWDAAIDVYRALFEVFPDSLDYGLALAHAQIGGGHGTDALATVNVLRRLPAPLSEDPRIDLTEDSAAESLGDYKRDLSAAKKAAEKAQAIGASLLLAQALADQQWALQNLGQPDDAVKAAEESMRIFSQAGDKRGVALELGAMGIAMLQQGRAADARTKFTASLEIHRELGGKLAVAGGLNNLGEALMMLGEFNASRHSFEQALDTYRNLGHQDGVALAKTNLGALLLQMGALDEATRYFKDALEICTRLGDQSKLNSAKVSMAEALRLEGNFTEALRSTNEALQGFRKIGDRASAARAELSLARLSIDMGAPAKAAGEAQEADLEFTREKEADNSAIANAVLARALMNQGRSKEAAQALAIAQSNLNRCDRYEARLAVAMSSALLATQSKDPAANKTSLNLLGQVAAQAQQKGFMSYAFESRLAMAETEYHSGSLTAARTHLESLHREAAARNFKHIADQAAALLSKTAPQSHASGNRSGA